jgi:hypothetical protein
MLALLGHARPPSYEDGIWLAPQLRTHVLDVDHARLPEPGVVHGGALVVGNYTAVASLRDAQAVDRSTGRFGDGIVQLLAIGAKSDCDGLGELLNGFTWFVVSFP